MCYVMFLKQFAACIEMVTLTKKICTVLHCLLCNSLAEHDVKIYKIGDVGFVDSNGVKSKELRKLCIHIPTFSTEFQPDLLNNVGLYV